MGGACATEATNHGLANRADHPRWILKTPMQLPQMGVPPEHLACSGGFFRILISLPQRDDGLFFRPLGRQPNDGCAVAAGTKGRLAVGREGDRRDLLVVAAESEDFFAAVSIPELDRMVAATGQDASGVRRIGHRRNCRRVPVESKQLLAGLRVPNDSAVVLAACDCPAGVGTECCIQHGPLMPRKDLSRFHRLQVPDTSRPIVGGGEDESSVT